MGTEVSQEYSEALKKALDILDQQNAKLQLQENEADKLNDLNEQRRVLSERTKVETMLKLLRSEDEVEGSGSRANKGNLSHESLKNLTDDGLKIKETPNDDLIFDGEFVWPLTGIVVNLPTRIEESKLRDEFLKRGFNPININYMWDQSGFIALVEFEQGLTGLCNAMSFERAHEKDHHGKKDWLFCNKNKNNGLFAWIARAEDYISGEGIIGEYLRSGRVLKDFMGVYFEEEFGNKDKNVLEITNGINGKTKDLKKTALELSHGILSLCDLVERKDKILKAQNEDVGRVRSSARGYFERCLKEQEKLKLQLESKTTELESRKTEFDKQEMEYQSEIKRLVDHNEKMEATHKREVGELKILIIKEKNVNHEAMKDELRRIEMEKRKAKMEKKMEKRMKKKMGKMKKKESSDI